MTWLDVLALAPVLVLVIGATTLLMAGAWYHETRPLIAGGIAVALVAAVTAGVAPPSPMEIAGLFSSAPFARYFAILWSLVAALILMLSLRYASEREFAAGEYVALVLFSAAGMALLSGATSLVGLFLSLESFTLALYILVSFHRNNNQGAEAGLKYLVLGAVATGFMAFGIALIYAASGTFHLPEALNGLQVGGHLRPWGLLGWGLALVAIGFKISLVPFHLWTPDVYQGAPAPVTALLATGSKGAVGAALVMVLASAPGAWQELVPLLWVLALLTMLVGSLCALPQENLKRLLAYSSVVHMGYLLTALLPGSPEGYSAVVFYLTVYTAASLGAFAVITSLSNAHGEPQKLAAWHGLGYRYPVRGAVLATCLLSLAGMPLTGGFIGKFVLFHAAIKGGFTGLAVVAILASLVSFAYYLRVVMVLYSSDEPAPALHPGTSLEHAVLLVCVSAILLLGLYPAPLLDLIATLIP
ncbi:MAG: NADH-quinone oxidoreductase subunit N [Desulfuromonadales bacterium]|nr:NADH-quinone oxidoreductase subunit N [Desulfuromonadales bacterium]